MRSKKQIIIIILCDDDEERSPFPSFPVLVSKENYPHVSSSLRKRPTRRPFWTHKAKKKKESDERDFRLLCNALPIQQRYFPKEKKLKLAP